MARYWFAAVVSALALGGATFAQADNVTETIVIMRHGEKPAGGYGQLNCQGLNRAMALPRVLGKLFGRPAAIFAPNPAGTVDDPAGKFDYVRPLATIEPTAIAFGLPVDASIGFLNLAALEKALKAPSLRSSLVFVAWEHLKAEDLARALVTANGGDGTLVPKWAHDDFDSLYVVKLVASGSGRKAAFTLMHEGLNSEPASCPQ
jgi:hypothetical protein